MPTYHTVKQGEYLSKIALKYGFANYLTIWDHPENAQLKKKRKNPNILFPGDRLYIPEKDYKEVTCSTQQRHSFRLKTKPLMLRIMLKDFGNQAICDTKCELLVESEVYKLTTDSKGFIEQEIPRTSESGKLNLKDAETGVDIEVYFKIGHLDPVEEVSGQSARLNNLGYNAGPADEQLDEEQFRSALEEFQCDYMGKNDVDGICGPKTQAKLLDVHGC